MNPDEERLLTALVDQAAVAIERIQLAAEMDAARLAAETERLRSALLSSLSHDLKTPLASITGAATSLRQYGGLYDAAAREELAATIQGEAERLSRFVANLLDMTRLRAGGIALKREPIDLGEAVGAALQRMQGVLGEHQVVVDLSAGLPMLDLDVVLFEQVLVNLLDNAAKYSPPGSTIAIGAAGNGRQMELTVSDEGPGIPPEDLERVFEMFHRVNKGDRQRAGTGLGLSICRGFVEVLGGTIQAANRIDGSGATFTITFPEGRLHRPAPGGCRRMTARGSIPLLVVDDEPPIRRLLRTSLAVQGYRILEAGTARAALDVVAREAPEVMLLDLGLPDQDGLEVIRRLRAAGSKVAIIVLSSRGDEPGKVEALDLGADDYVTKPFGMAELVARIRTALRHRVQRQGAEPLFTHGDLSVDLTRRRVTVRGAEVKLSNKEWDILRLLVLHAGKC